MIEGVQKRYYTNGIRFVPIGWVEAENSCGVALNIEFPDRADNPIIEGILVKECGQYAITAVHFNQDKNHGFYTLSEIHFLCKSVVETDCRAIFDEIYTAYLVDNWKGLKQLLKSFSV